jgi:hypothetical protein
MALHPQAQAFLEEVRDSGNPRIYELSAVEVRAAVAPFAGLIGDGPAVEEVEELSIPVRDAEIPGRRYRPAGAHGTIVWLHGGGWVMDGIEASDAMCRILATSAAATVVSVDYRVAPEHPFPVPLDDCFDALSWVAALDRSSPLLAAGRRRRQRGRQHGRRVRAARQGPRRPVAGRAGARLPGHRHRHDDRFLPRTRGRRAVDARNRGDGVVLRPVPAERR